MRNHSRAAGSGYKAVACGVLLALSVPAGAAGAAAKAADDSYSGKVTRLRDKFKHDDALKLIEEARKSPSNTKEQLVTLDLLEGVLLYEVTQQPNLAEQSFLRALTASPDAQIRLEVSPKITGLLEEVRARVKRPVVVPPPSVDPGPPVPPAGAEGGSGTTISKKVGGGQGLVAYRTPLAIAGGGLAAVGIFTWVQAKSTEQRLRAGDTSIDTRAQFDEAVRRGRTFETVGWILAGAGAATTLGSLLLLRPSPAVPSVGAGPVQGGAHVSFSWRTP